MASPLESGAAGTACMPRFELRFLPRRGDRHCLAFPCNASGHVEIDRLSERERTDYLFARALRGRDYSSHIVTSPDGSGTSALS